MLIRSRAPLRVGLAGGGTDVSPYCDLYGGYVLNATINRYAYATLRCVNTSILNFASTDQGISESLEIKEGVLIPLNGILNLHKAVYNSMISEFNNGKHLPIELSTFCDAPIGSGLGASSTLVVAMIRAFVELLNLPLDDYSIARLAFKIERIDCELQGGRQDQYSATFGGVNFIEFPDVRKVVVNSLRLKEWIVSELEASLLLFYTGVSRESAKIIADQSSSVKDLDSNTLESMHLIKQEAIQMKEYLLKGEFQGIVESMKLGWSAKKRSANTVSNPLIDSIYKAAIESGALSGKVSGAGGGGFMMFFIPPEKRMAVINSLKNFSGEIGNCHFTNSGAEAWRVL
jgi:D-glycero-alpha-D-manno-heptose-7-phosphate kinase